MHNDSWYLALALMRSHVQTGGNDSGSAAVAHFGGRSHWGFVSVFNFRTAAMSLPCGRIGLCPDEPLASMTRDSPKWAGTKSHPPLILNCWKPVTPTLPTARFDTIPMVGPAPPLNTGRSVAARAGCCAGLSVPPELSGAYGQRLLPAGWRLNHVDRSNHSLPGRSRRVVRNKVQTLRDAEIPFHKPPPTRQQGPMNW